jgi:hypothetical protein
MLPETLHQAIRELREELDRIDYAIRQIEAVEQGKALRGRPPKHASAWEDSSDVAKRGARRE